MTEMEQQTLQEQLAEVAAGKACALISKKTLKELT